MQKQHTDYDLLAVFTDEAKADTTVAKLRKEGFSEEEVYQLAAGASGTGQFREHGPNRERGQVFLQTRRSGPNPIMVMLLAVVGGVVLGGLGFALPPIAHLTLTEPATGIEGGTLGVVLGAIVGLLQRGRLLGAIGQQQANTASKKPTQGARTVVALRFPDTENISRQSRARAILINNGGKIDRSVGRRD